MTRKDLAAALNITEGHLYKLEHGKEDGLPFRLLERWAAMLGMHLVSEDAK